MDIQEAKTIRLADYLQSIGYSPVKQQGSSLWYKSPFRQETEASFKVNTELNQWFDFGLGKGGNILALAKELYQDDYVPTLLERIERQTPHIYSTSFSFRQQPSEPSFQQLEVQELAHPALLRYLQERAIDVAVAKSECKELHFTHNGKPYFAIGFENVTGGYEVRNQFLKGCIAPKDITHIWQQERQTDTCYLFEGFMDYLSFLTIRKRKNPQYPDLKGQDYMVLNSVSNLGKAIERLSHYERIHCFFDNDQAGNRAYWELQRTFSYRLRDASIHYAEYKDLNDFLCGKRAVENKASKVSVRPQSKKKGFRL
ncbi:toprim domain-containing protein [Bacteroides fragilis]|uniref:toprim domain-containing protein n=1 Tax=Bacteroides fragilis TaxID=817 RepID=UPI00187A7914|nr:toprim domain-containing protein [Bacteroides fragilis]MBE7398668.1 toprim domain-containing protein [Bacteroides fragilis]